MRIDLTDKKRLPSDSFGETSERHLHVRALAAAMLRDREEMTLRELLLHAAQLRRFLSDEQLTELLDALPQLLERVARVVLHELVRPEVFDEHAHGHGRREALEREQVPREERCACRDVRGKSVRERVVGEGQVEQVFAERVLDVGGLDDLRVATKEVDRQGTAEIVGESADDPTFHFLHVFFGIGVVGHVDEIVHARDGHLLVFTSDQQG